jgi:hypothetical protein
MKSASQFLLIACVSLATAGMAACAADSAGTAGEEAERPVMEQIAPDESARHAAPKPDSLATVRRDYDTDANFYARPDGNVVVHASTNGMSPVSVGIVYATTARTSEALSAWQTAYGHYTYTSEDDALHFVVEAPVYSPRYFRYAVFAVDAEGQTVWDNSGGNDFYIFPKTAGDGDRGDPVRWMGHDKTDDEVTVHVTSVNLGMEKLFVSYTFDGWKTQADVEAVFDDSRGYDLTMDTWDATIPYAPGHTELEYVLRFETDGSTIWANNHDTNYHVGLVEADPAVIRYTTDDVQVEGELKAGGWFTVAYERQAQFTSCYHGMCNQNVAVHYRLYDNQAFWKTTMTRNNRACDHSGGDSYGTGWCPEHFGSDATYIPQNAETLSMWFRHIDWRGGREGWDSNFGKDYDFELR